MAIVTNTALTYDTIDVSTEEHLSKVFDVISPVDTFFWSAIGKFSETPKSDKMEWLTRVLAAAAANAAVEGDQRTPAALTASTRVYNKHQIQYKTFLISASQEQTASPKNVNSEAYNVAEQMKLLAQDVEFAAWRGVRADGSSTVAREMRGALNWMRTNVDMGANATLNADGTLTGGTARALDISHIRNLMQNIYVAGGKGDKLYCAPFQATKISGFAGVGNYRRTLEKGKLEDYVDIYVNEFGKTEVIVHRNFPTNVVAIMDLTHWKKSIWRPIKKEYVPTSADGKMVDLRTEHTLIANAEASSGRIVDLLTQ